MAHWQSIIEIIVEVLRSKPKNMFNGFTDALPFFVCVCGGGALAHPVFLPPWQTAAASCTPSSHALQHCFLSGGCECLSGISQCSVFTHTSYQSPVVASAAPFSSNPPCLYCVDQELDDIQWRPALPVLLLPAATPVGCPPVSYLGVYCKGASAPCWWRLGCQPYSVSIGPLLGASRIHV